MLHTELYKVFYYVSIYKNISKASEVLYISQPAVSKSIKKLEQLTDCTLFIRNSKGVTLTSEGEILFEYVEKAFNYLINGEKIIEKINKKEEGIVKIGISNTLCKYFFIPYLEKFHQKYPKIKIQIINCSSPSTYKLLDDGQIDFGIVSFPVQKYDYQYTSLMTISDIFVASNKYMPNIKKCTLEQLSTHPLMLLEKENQTRIFIDNFLLSQGIELKPEIEIGSMDFLIEFAKIGIGVACVIKEFVIDDLLDNSLIELPIKPAPPKREI